MGIRTLKDLLKREDPSIVFIFQIKVLASFFELRKFSFGYSYCFAVNFVGRSGGLAQLWKKEVDIEILKFLTSIIHCRIVANINYPIVAHH